MKSNFCKAEEEAEKKKEELKKSDEKKKYLKLKLNDDSKFTFTHPLRKSDMVNEEELKSSKEVKIFQNNLILIFFLEEKFQGD